MNTDFIGMVTIFLKLTDLLRGKKAVYKSLYAEITLVVYRKHRGINLSQ